MARSRLTKAQRGAIAAVYHVLNTMPRAGLRTTESVETLKALRQWGESIQGPAMLALEAVMNGDDEECTERGGDLVEAYAATGTEPGKDPTT